MEPVSQAAPPRSVSSRGGRIRLARPDEAAHLTALTVRSKAYWGYDDAFMQACIPVLTVEAEWIAAPSEHYFVTEDDAGAVVGYASLRLVTTDPHAAELTNLFVEPDAIGQGYGWQLWQHAITVARSLGVRRVRIEADPFAEQFYLRQGVVRVGETPSDAIPGRVIPLLTFELDAERTGE